MEQQSRDLDLLDLAVLLVRHANLLIGAMVLGAILAVGWTHLLPPKYVSHAMVHLPRPHYLMDGLVMGGARVSVQTPPEAAKVMKSPIVLDPVIVKLNLNDSVSTEIARQRLATAISISVGPEYVLFLEVAGGSPRQAQERAEAILDAWLTTMQPSPREQAELEGLLAQAQASLLVVNDVIKHLTAESKARLQRGDAQGGSESNLALAIAMQPYLQRQVDTISGMLGGLARDAVKQKPTLPSGSKDVRWGLFGLLGAALGGGLALLWVVLIDAWRRSSENPVFAERLKRLRSAGKRN